MKINSKKGITVTALIASLVIMAFVVLSLIFWFGGGVAKGFGLIGESLIDTDGDGRKDTLDRCPCTDFTEFGEREGLPGCPYGTKPKQAQDDRENHEDFECENRNLEIKIEKEEISEEEDEEPVSGVSYTDLKLVYFTIGNDASESIEFDLLGRYSSLSEAMGKIEFEVLNNGLSESPAIFTISTSSVNNPSERKIKKLSVSRHTGSYLTDKIDIGVIIPEDSWGVYRASRPIYAFLGEDDDCDCGKTECSCFVTVEVRTTGEVREVSDTRKDNYKQIELTLKNRIVEEVVEKKVDFKINDFWLDKKDDLLALSEVPGSKIIRVDFNAENAGEKAEKAKFEFYVCDTEHILFKNMVDNCKLINDHTQRVGNILPYSSVEPGKSFATDFDSEDPDGARELYIDSGGKEKENCFCGQGICNCLIALLLQPESGIENDATPNNNFKYVELTFPES